MERDAGFARQPRDIANGLEGSELVVGVHDGDQDGIGTQGAADIVRIHDAGGSGPDVVTATPSRSSWAQVFSTAGCSMAL